MDNKYGHKHPTPATIRMFISRAIADETAKNTREDTAMTFSAIASSIVDEAISKACEEFDKDGVYAGLDKFAPIKPHHALELRTMRHRKKLSQRQLADLTGVGQSVISRLEAGKTSDIGYDKMQTILDVLNG